ncbi:MAG: lysozyme family protein [Eubacteriales bacterium]|nr:lysozyme family protein [Eubacteriales bacterium]
MRDIKTKERDRKPKILTKASRMPKELARKAVLEAKEKSLQGSRISDGIEARESPSEYAGNKAEAVLGRGMEKGSRTALQVSYQAGKKTAQETYQKLKMRSASETKNREPSSEGAAKAVETPETQGASGAQKAPETPVQKGKELAVKAAEKEAAKKKTQAREPERPAGNALPSRSENPQRERSIRTKETISRTIKEPMTRQIPAGKQIGQISVKRAPRMSGAIILQEKKNGKAVLAAGKMRAEKMAKQAAIYRLQSGTRRSQHAASMAVRMKRVVEAAAKAIRNGAIALLAGAGSMFLVLVIIAGVIGGVFAYSSSSQNSASLSEQVLAYTAAIQRYASQYGIPEYVPVIQAIMMQESGGNGTDPMQSSECPYNTRFPNSPGAITDPEYSIEVGIQYYADCLREAGCSSPQDMDKLKLSLQGYNYGNGYISWALQHYGGYSEANALLFSQQQAASHGWARYGDPEYVPHVLRYYSGGNPFGALFGNEQIVSVALSQLGNAGGQKFWSWYGFDSHVSWCACFVSWCGDQCGLIESGQMPKFALCDDGIAWFKSKGKWQERGYTPSPGTLIFFDWPGQDGVSDHVGIVEKCEGGMVYTVEGNSSNAVNQRSYDINNASIMGYGLVTY